MKKIPEHVLKALAKNNLSVSDVLLSITGKGHIQIVLPNGRKVHGAFSPSCHLADKNMASDIKRALNK